MGKKRDTDEPRISLQGMRVLNVFFSDFNQELAGSDVARVSGLQSGTLYPILFRFESAGWLQSHWEQLEPEQAGRPRRRLYKLTSTGIARANEILSEFGRWVPA